jgi:hypothetical protein
MNDEFPADEGPAQDVAWIVDALRSPARPGEIGDGAQTVSAMSAVVTAAAESVSLRRRHGHRRFAVLVGTAVVGVGGVAAAGASVSRFDIDLPIIGDQTETTEASVVETGTTTAVATTTITTTTTTTTMVVSPAVPDGGTPSDGADGDDIDAHHATSDTTGGLDDATTTTIECAEGNHGDTVTSVARETPPGSDHAPAVVAAAQSDCGKSTDDSSTTTTVTVDTTTVPDTSAPGTPPPGNGNAGNDNDNGGNDNGGSNGGNGNGGNGNGGDGNGPAIPDGPNGHANANATVNTNGANTNGANTNGANGHGNGNAGGPVD